MGSLGLDRSLVYFTALAPVGLQTGGSLLCLALGAGMHTTSHTALHMRQPRGITYGLAGLVSCSSGVQRDQEYGCICRPLTPLWVTLPICRWSTIVHLSCLKRRTEQLTSVVRVIQTKIVRKDQFIADLKTDIEMLMNERDLPSECSHQTPPSLDLEVPDMQIEVQHPPSEPDRVGPASDDGVKSETGSARSNGLAPPPGTGGSTAAVPPVQDPTPTGLPREESAKSAATGPELDAQGLHLALNESVRSPSPVGSSRANSTTFSAPGTPGARSGWQSVTSVGSRRGRSLSGLLSRHRPVTQDAAVQCDTEEVPAVVPAALALAQPVDKELVSKLKRELEYKDKV